MITTQPDVENGTDSLDPAVESLDWALNWTHAYNTGMGETDDAVRAWVTSRRRRPDLSQRLELVGNRLLVTRCRDVVVGR